MLPSFFSLSHLTYIESIPLYSHSSISDLILSPLKHQLSLTAPPLLSHLWKSESVSWPFVSDSLWPHGLLPTKLLHPRNSLFFFYFILFFNFTILYWFCHISIWIRHRYTHVPSPEPSRILEWVTFPFLQGIFLTHRLILYHLYWDVQILYHMYCQS